MRKILLSIVLLLPVIAAAQGVKKHEQPLPTKDLNILDVTLNRTTAVVYDTPKELKAKVQRDARAKKWNEALKKEELAKVPTGGILLIDILRYTAASVDPKLFTVLVLDATGQERLRTKLEASIVSPAIVAGVSGYKNSGRLVLDQPLKTGEFVCILDEKENKRYEFLVKND
ncbi:hypothetical protein EFA69_16935 [Rufibacter immobilis]|uniref:Uncharacterized protein n=1 Tax=Rufibacter immobilis TaxID=1348778 RepID=A0A3M9MQI3_9BACT|nr:hypothetical protein [Rufibacter immobilis]RNI27792.1 hypothetical protein EFA69_16935 [Rufibacter immobilis]